MHLRTLLFAFSFFFACVLPTRAEFDTGDASSAKPNATRPSQPALGTAVANARPPYNLFKVARRLDVNILLFDAEPVAVGVLVFPVLPPAAQILPPPVIKNPSNVPRQRH